MGSPYNEDSSLPSKARTEHFVGTCSLAFDFLVLRVFNGSSQPREAPCELIGPSVANEKWSLCSPETQGRDLPCYFHKSLVRGVWV